MRWQAALLCCRGPTFWRTASRRARPPRTTALGQRPACTRCVVPALRLDRSGEPADARSHLQALVSQLSLRLLSLQTEVCCSWKKTGRCRYGSKCQFAHGEEELKPVNRHPKYKTEVHNCFVCAPLPHKMLGTYLSPSHVPMLRFAPNCTSDLVGSICKLLHKLFKSELHLRTSGGMPDRQCQGANTGLD